MSQYTRDFARHLINDREGEPVTVSTIVAVLDALHQGTNRVLAGDSADERRDNLRKELMQDEGLAYDPVADTFDTPNDGETADDFKARRNLGAPQ